MPSGYWVPARGQCRVPGLCPGQGVSFRSLLQFSMQNGVLGTLDLWVCQFVTVSNLRPISVADLKVINIESPPLPLPQP